MKAIIHNFYIMESDGANNYTIYSGPSAAKPIQKEITGYDNAKTFLLSL